MRRRRPDGATKVFMWAGVFVLVAVLVLISLYLNGALGAPLGYAAPLSRLRGVAGQERVGERAMTLQQLGAARGLTLEQLAERSGVALTTVVKIDAGSIRVQPATLRRLAAVLDMDTQTLRDELSAARRGQQLPPPSGTPWR